MKHTELLEQIREMPLVEQLALAEAILHGLGNWLRRTSSLGAEDQESLQRQMRQAAQEAAAYYRNDPDVALWCGLEGVLSRKSVFFTNSVI